MRFLTVSTACCLAVLLGSSLAEASGGFGLGGPAKGVYYPVGGSIGYGFGRHENSELLLGLEGSIANLTRSGAWYGGYLDGLYAFSTQEARFSLGPELGFGPFGLDAGLLLVRRGGEFEEGLVVRSMLTLGFVAVYGRVGQILSGPSDTFGELGCLVKFPLRH